MPTFKMTKSVSDIQEPELLPDDWYLVRIVSEPQIMPNAKKRDGGDLAEGAGDNIVLRLRVQHENPAFNGRPFTKWLGVPTEADKEEYNSFNGMTIEDTKLERIRKWAAAFNNVPENKMKSKSVNFESGQEAFVFITSETDFRDEEKIINVLDMNAAPRPA